MDDFANSAEVARWARMSEWIVESLPDQPVGFLLDMGPENYVDGEEREAICAQIQVLEDDVLMLRRSRVMLRQLLLTDYSTDGLTLDRWHYDGHFDDCTDGYLFSRDIRLIGESCVTWFRDHSKTDSTDDLGCEYRFPDELRPSQDGD